MSFDFTNEEDQKEFKYGPVPAGSYVIVETEVLAPKEPAPENPELAVSKNNLRGINIQYTVVEGEYEGVRFRQWCTFNQGSQVIRLDERQLKSCTIGGALIKALLQAAQRSTRINSVKELDGLKVPVQLGIDDRPYEKDGNVYWNNKISKVITPTMAQYNEVRSRREIINENGAVTGKGKPTTSNDSYAYSGNGSSFGSMGGSEQVDSVPF